MKNDGGPAKFVAGTSWKITCGGKGAVSFKDFCEAEMLIMPLSHGDTSPPPVGLDPHYSATLPLLKFHSMVA